MFLSLLRNPIQFLITKQRSNPTTTTHLHFLHNFSSISQTPEAKEPNHSTSLTISYLINSCGLSPQSALSASQKITIKSTEKPDSVLSALKSYDFTDTHIAKIITKYPQLLSFNFDSIIKPKLEYFIRVGYSTNDLTALISLAPQLLHRSLENRLRPNLDLLRSILGSTQLVAAAIHRCTRLLENNLETNFLPNVALLQSYGVPWPNIASLATRDGRVLMHRPEQFKMIAAAIRRMGFDPLSTLFVRGIVGMAEVNPSAWERKTTEFKKLGWSEEEIVKAFMKEPSIMQISDEKLRRVMIFFVKKMHWGPDLLSKKPVLLKYSFEKRIVPRFSVVSVLASRGLAVEKPFPLFFTMNDEKFLKFYVTKYQEQVPEVLEVYKVNAEWLDGK